MKTDSSKQHEIEPVFSENDDRICSETDRSASFRLGDYALPPLSAEETNALLHRAADGDKEAKDSLVLHNINLVRMVAGNYKDRIPSGCTPDDLVQEGVKGLLNAISKYDFSKGVQFSTFAVSQIRPAILDFLSDNASPIYFTSHAQEARSKIIGARQVFEEKNGRAPTDEELSTLSGVSVETMRNCMLDKYFFSLDDTLGNDSDTTFESVTADELQASPFEITCLPVCEEIKSKLLEDALDCLPNEEYRQIILYSCGFYGEEFRTAAAISDLFGCSRQNISEKLAKAKAYLHRFGSAHLQEYYDVA